jgi:molecular chaperone DnaJ
MVKRKDNYVLLEVDRDCSQAEIKTAYRKLARKYHPDVNPGNTEAATKFKEIKEAYDVLKNPLTRDRYDQYGHRGLEPGFEGSNNYSEFIVTDSEAEPVQSSDLFRESGMDDIYNISITHSGTDAATAPEPGADLRYDLDISFEDAAFGLNTQVNIPVFRECDMCFGTGAQPGTNTRKCNVCKGKGTVSVSEHSSQGSKLVQTTCNTCFGRGLIVDYPCSQCKGTSQVQKLERILVKVPSGVDNGSCIRVHGKGAPGNQGGLPGDLYVVLHVRDHEIFERHGSEILCETLIDFVQAVFGAEIQVPTLEGPAKMRIPPGTQTGTIFRLRGKGLIDPQTGKRGDQHVKVTVVTPTKLNERQKKLLMKYAMAANQ